MKVSRNWVAQYINFDLPPIEEVVDRIGEQLGAVEEVENLAEKYQGVIIAKIISCVDHENSDHLHVCMIDDGGKSKDVERDERGHVQVLCGAPNVREGIFVAWLPPGSTVPESVGKDPFVLGTREMRGKMSNGMLASPRELALGENHDGIMELDGDLTPGDDFAVAYQLDDYVIDIENKMFTHRPDCFGVLGVAREISGIFGHKFTSPEWYLQTQESVLGTDAPSLPLEVQNELPSLVPRFVATPLSGIEIKPSPTWLQTYLLRSGVRPINNVVDITNYLMLLTGQPMHAYDYDKVKKLSTTDKAVLVVRYPRQNEKITLLNGKEVQPREEAILIATEKNLLGIGGVMGGADSEVDENTQNIILEVATFDMYSIRRTSMAHGLFTDAVTRFNKGQSPLQNDEINAHAVAMLREFAGAKVAGPVVDNNHVDDQSRKRRWVHPPVPVTTEFINVRLGFSLLASDMQTLLGNVECSVTADGDKLLVQAPFWRTDIETREDVVEEIGRLYGFDKLPLELPKRSIQVATKDESFELKRNVRQILAKYGANEVLTYSFVHGDLLRRVGQDADEAFQVSNALSPDLQYYRISLTPSLLDKIHMNVKAGFDRFALFEMGKVHGKTQLDNEGLPREFERIAFVYAANDKYAINDGAAYFEAHKYLEGLLSAFGIRGDCTLVPASTADLDVQPFYLQVMKPFDLTRSALIYVNDRPLGIVGEYSAAVRKALKLPVHSAGFEFGLNLFPGSRQISASYEALPRFPKVTQDITLRISSELPFADLSDFVIRVLSEVKPGQARLGVKPLGIFQREDDSAHKQVSFRVELASYEKTLRDVEVSKLLDELAVRAKEHFSAERA